MTTQIWMKIRVVSAAFKYQKYNLKTIEYRVGFFKKFVNIDVNFQMKLCLA